MNLIHVFCLICIAVSSITCAPPLGKEFTFYDAIVQKCPSVASIAEYKDQILLKSCSNWTRINSTVNLTDENKKDVLCLLYYNSFTEYCRHTKHFNISVPEDVRKLTLRQVCDKLEVMPKQLSQDNSLHKVIKDAGDCRKVCVDEVGWVKSFCGISYYYNHQNQNFESSRPVISPQKNGKLVSKEKNLESPQVEEHNSQTPKKLEEKPLEAAKSNKNDAQPTPNTPKNTKDHSSQKSVEPNNIMGSPQDIDQSSKPVSATNHDFAKTEQKPEPIQSKSETGSMSTKPQINSIKPQDDSINNNHEKDSTNNNKAQIDSVKNKPQVVDTKNNLQADSNKNEPETKVNPKNVDASPSKQKETAAVTEAPLAPPVVQEERNELEPPLQEEANKNIPIDEDQQINESEEEAEDSPFPKIVKSEKAKPPTIDESEAVNYTTEMEGDSYFFTYFMFLCVIFVAGYVCYHNKQKILALILEGRRGKKQFRGRRPNSANYHKLDSNLEEAITSSCNKNTNNVIY